MRYAHPLLLLPLVAAPLVAQRPVPPAPPPPATRALPPLRAIPPVAPLPPIELEWVELDRLLASQLALESHELALTLETEARLHAVEAATLAVAVELEAAQVAALDHRTRDILETELAFAAQGYHTFPATAGGLTSLRPARGTQEDSLYQLARQTLNRGEYLRAAELFQTYQQRYPNARTAPAALYWRAFALYRSGSDADLRAALASLEAQRSRYPATANDSDAAALQVRVNAALAARGDQQAAAAVRLANAQGVGCDREEMEVRAEALNALVRQDETGAGTILARVLAQRDECSATLRRRAVYHLGRRGDPDVVPRLLEVARNDPDRAVRTDAIAILGRMPGVQTIHNLEQLFMTSTDERVHSAIFTAIRGHDTPEARQLLRRYIERTDLTDAQRVSAINALTNTGRTTTVISPSAPRVTVTGQATVVSPTQVSIGTPARSDPDDEDSAFLRGLYPRQTSRVIKEAIINGLARIGGTANDRWLLELARNNNEEMRYRSSALSRMRTARFPIEELGRLYDGVSDRTLRTAIINTLGAREEDAATDKLLDIVRRGTDPTLRRQAINALSRKNDPRATRLLLELIER